MTTEHVLHDYIAGALGGATGLVFGHPFDTTKVQLQTQLHGNQYLGTLDAIKHINKQGLSKGFFRGLSWPLVSFGIVNSVYFGVYGNTLKLLEKDRENRKSSYANIFLAGCVGGAFQLIPAVPFDYIKVVLQSQIPHQTKNASGTTRVFFKGPIEASVHIYRTRGLTGFYKGLTIMAWRDIYSFGLYSLTFEYLNSVLNCKGWTDTNGIIADLLAGGSAGSVCWMSIMPFDVIKSRYQSDLKTEFKGIFDCAYKSYKEEGFRVFYRGSIITCLRAFPVNAVTFLVYSQSMKYMERR